MTKIVSFGVVSGVVVALVFPGCSASGGAGAARTDAGSGGAAGAAGASGAAAAGNGGMQANGGNAGTGGATGGTSGAAASGGTAGDAAGEGGAAGEPNLGPPNIIVVLLDDMGYSDLGAYGGEIRTPAIDALAQSGTRFRNFYVTPRCSPTRISLLTGLYTQQAATEPGASLPPLRTNNNVTLPEMLAAAGYRTYMAGKWHLGTDVQQRPSARGFQHVFGFGDYGAGAEENKWDKTKYGFVSQNNAITKIAYGDGEHDFYQADAFSDYALEYLNHHDAQNDGAPFFMYLAYNAPHFPIQAERSLVENAPAAGGQSYLDTYAQGWNVLRDQRHQRMLDQGVLDDSFALSPAEPYMSPVQEIPLWSTLSNAQKADATRKMGLYAASIESVDTSLSRVVARLKAEGKFDNTLIFVLSDNGGNYEGGVYGTSFGKSDPLTGTELENMGQPGAGDHVQSGGGWANVQTTPFRFYKHYTHGGGVRSPLVVSWPANTAAPGGWTDQVAHVIDITPTILEAAGVAHPDEFDGHAVLPMAGTPLVNTIANGAPPTARQIGFEHETNRAWIDGKFKLVVRHETGDVLELYNLEADPSELDDLAAAQPVRLANMVAAWNAWATEVGVPAERLLAVP